MDSKVILTIDDIPQGITVKMIDYLAEKNIPSVMFAVGENIEKDMDTVVYAIKKGIIIGNHSYSHPAFSSLSFEECKTEIEKTEVLLEKAYFLAGVSREVKVFRFPYIDKGSDKKEKLQDYLREHGFMKIDDTAVTAVDYHKAGHDRDIDAACSFDIREYNIPPGTMSFEDVMTHLYEGDGENGADIMNRDGTNIVLLHSHDDTEKIVPGYYSKVLDAMLERKIQFIKPNWIKFS